MSNSEDISARNREHYDSVTDAWGYLLGDNLHYGFFAPGISTGYCQVLVAHSALDGKTPQEVYYKMSPACERSRFEPRARWPRTARCAFPQAPVVGNRGAPIRLDVRYDGGRKHLPIVDLRLVA